MTELSIERGGVTLAGARSGEGIPVVLLHGLTASRRYVVMGSRLLERSGHDVIAYDARGHGASSPAPDPAAYGYEELGADLLATLDHLGVRDAVLAGSSMGGHTALWLALNAPERVRGLVVITPGYDPTSVSQPESLRRWDALADGLERGGIEGFVEAYGQPEAGGREHEIVVAGIRQRMALHEHPEAVAAALRVVPRSRPFAELGELSAISVPALVIGSADQFDPGHPWALAEAYAAAIPGARLIGDRPGSSPLAWQGSQVSRLIAELAAEATG